MGLAEVQFDCMFADKCPIAKSALVHRASIVLGRGQGQWAAECQFVCDHLRGSLLLPKVLRRQFGQVLQTEAQVRLQVADVGGWSPELRGTVPTEEHRLARVHVLQKLGAPSSPQLVLDVSKPVGNGGHREACEFTDVDPFLGAQVSHCISALGGLSQAGGKLSL